VDQALAKRPEDRFESAAAFSDAIQAVMQGAHALPSRVLAAPAPPGRPMHWPVGAPLASPRDLPAPTHATPATVPMPAPLFARDRPLPNPSARAATPIAGLPRTNVALLVAVAIAFLCIGVGLALFLVKYVLR
jgi:hypothetical protein